MHALQHLCITLEIRASLDLQCKARYPSSCLSQARVMQVRPEKQIALPYASYRLCKADGAAVERTDKHPFCMSRVYYDAHEKPQEIWAQMADGSCRWRQSGSEIKVIALKVCPGHDGWGRWLLCTTCCESLLRAQASPSSPELRLGWVRAVSVYGQTSKYHAEAQRCMCTGHTDVLMV